MSIIQKSDRYTETISEQMKIVFGSKDIIDTMRFTELDGVEEFSNSMAYGNARSWLYTGISQLQKEAEALEKYQKGDRSEVPPNAEYEPEKVADLLSKWKKYKLDLAPEHVDNLTVVLNDLWRYNRNLMWVVHVFFPIHLAVLNGRYARGSRTFKAFIELGKNLYQREHEVNIGRSSQGRSITHPFRKTED